ncbi:MAG TPA: DUF4190 domain-containing protein [Thermoleophilaceae bacterium]|nr:DUF4190 domain-containing protein [Thermoleophilaceae bacterium]
MEGRDSEFLPPEPPGPEPEVSEPPAKREPPPPPAQQTYGYPPPPPAQGQGYAPPPPGQPYYPPPQPGYGQQPPPGYPQQHPQQAYPPPWGYAQAPVPDNGQAVAGFVFSIVSLGLLVISAGLSSVVSVGCAIAGIICGRNGKRKVDRGETPKHRGLAQAGFIIGWVGLALSILATIGWILFIVLAATDDDFNWEDYESATAAILAVSWRILM